jgi:hypothetical protein
MAGHPVTVNKKKLAISLNSLRPNATIVLAACDQMNINKNEIFQPLLAWPGAVAMAGQCLRPLVYRLQKHFKTPFDGSCCRQYRTIRLCEQGEIYPCFLAIGFSRSAGVCGSVQGVSQISIMLCSERANVAKASWAICSLHQAAEKRIWEEVNRTPLRYARFFPYRPHSLHR